MPMRRDFVDIDTRSVHFHHGGSGPALVMIHQSPRSAAELLPLAEEWSLDFTCIVPDTPGFGGSDPLPPGAGLDDFADALAAFIEALGLPCAALYGEHTGAIIALAAAVRHPQRVTALAAHGYAAWTIEERAAFTRDYLPPFRPTTYGEHLVWLWNRCREQRRFFPWYRPADDTRIFYGVASPEELTEEALDFLRAGDAYRAGYGSAFESDAEMPERLAVPTLLVGSKTDPLTSHMERLSDLPGCVETALTGDWNTARKAAREWLRHTLAATFATISAPPGRHRMVQVTTPQWHGRLHATGDAEADILLLPQPGGSAETALHDADGAALALDPPGHGFSDPVGGLDDDPAAWARVIEAAAEALGLDRRATKLRLQGPAGALAPLLEGRFAQIEGQAPAWLAGTDHARWLPDLAPAPSGAHLLRAWDMLREREMFDPSWVHEPAAYRPLGDLDPDRLSMHLRALLEADGARAFFAACHHGVRAG